MIDAGQCVASGVECAAGVALAARASLRTFGSAGFDDVLAGLVEESGQADSVAACAFHRPDQPRPMAMSGDEGQHPTIALRGGLDRGRRQLGASRVHDARAVAVGVNVFVSSACCQCKPNNQARVVHERDVVSLNGFCVSGAEAHR